jgi:hypothetical protein
LTFVRVFEYLEHMPNVNCGTCSGEGVQVGDAVGRHGERIDDVQPCPDCTSDDFDEVIEHAPRAERVRAYDNWKHTSLLGALLRSLVEV